MEKKIIKKVKAFEKFNLAFGISIRLFIAFGIGWYACIIRDLLCLAILLL